ncbi:YjhX family toxin [Kordiimonas sp. SCSIO 12610]|uniref:YjhX family toxin n=1 Tax=Kordiimonas sp. SCSIO 12610 TaxID=2829597 RepID=UPI00210E4D41|nr:YjhX family toxin [Kordiimonas sp. SCSIO 12610]UTW55812.1 YjhX family toxin [Kordiimonas sp. SCSIO 12610]
MNISKMEQRALHTLAQGGAILIERDEKRKIVKASCVNREGWYLSGFSVDLFRKLKKRRFIKSQNSRPYRITLHGLSCVRSQLDNR